MNTDEPHPLLQATFAALEQAGVRYALLRWPANPAAPQGDVDLLVENADIGRMRAALRHLGLVRFPSMGSGNEHVFLAYHAASDCWIRLHVVTELSFGPRHRLRTGAASACLARCRHDRGVVQLAAEDEFWTTLLHCLLEKENIAIRHRDHLRKLASAAEPAGPLREVVQCVCPDGWGAARMVDSVRRGDWDELESLARGMQNAETVFHSAFCILHSACCVYRRVCSTPGADAA